MHRSACGCKVSRDLTMPAHARAALTAVQLLIYTTDDASFHAVQAALLE